MTKRKKDPVIAAKERKQKIVLGVLSVVFLALLAIEGPGTLRRLKGAAPAPPPASTTTTTTTAPSGPAGTTPSAAAPAATTTTSASSDAGLVQDSPGPPAPREGQLVSFSLFSVRDPFASQSPAGREKPPAGASGTATTKTKKKKTAAPGTGTGQTPTVQAPVPLPPVVPPAQTGTSTVPTAPSPTTTTPTTPQLPAVPVPTAATISVNGIKESVDVNGLFPSSSQIFQLRSVDSASATIAVAGGSFASGDATLTLQLGQPVTLMNTADGTRYELLLVSVP